MGRRAISWWGKRDGAEELAQIALLSLQFFGNVQADALVGAFHYDIPAVSKIPHGPRPVDFDVVRRSPSCLLDLGRHILALFWADPKLFFEGTIAEG